MASAPALPARLLPRLRVVEVTQGGESGGSIVADAVVVQVEREEIVDRGQGGGAVVADAVGPQIEVGEVGERGERAGAVVADAVRVEG